MQDSTPKPDPAAVAEAIWQRLAHPDLAPPPPTDWLIDGVLEAGALTFLFGKPEAGKSFAGIAAACSIATGEPFGNAREVLTPGRVLVLATEGGGGFARRLYAWAWHAADGNPERFDHLKALLAPILHGVWSGWCCGCAKTPSW